MQASAQQVFRDLDEGKWKPFYLIVGEEPFQASEITQRLKQFFLKGDNPADISFQYETFDGEHLDAAALLASLDQLPGLFDMGDGESVRLVVCSRFEKVTTASLEVLDGYLRNPSPTTCFVLMCAKADKRKAWYKKVDEKGAIIEVSEPYEREWPRWHGYFEKRIGKKIAADAWERAVESAGRKLSVLWSELTKVAIFVGERNAITDEDLKMLASGQGSADVFEFVEDVLLGRRLDAAQKYQRLIRDGENEIKVLSLLVRQFRIVAHYLEISAQGIVDSKRVATQLGVHPFFVSKIQQQAKKQTASRLASALDLLAECDFRLKTGDGGLFELFLAPYLAALP